MKKRLLSALLALCMALTLLPGTAWAANSPAMTSNAHSQNYAREASTVKSYLFENKSGGLTRVEYVPAAGYYTMQDNKLVFVETSEERLIVEDYSSGFEFQRSYSIPTELSIWGGFYAGEEYNFFIFGQKNSDSDDGTEVIRVVKYSKDWQRLGQASLRGANTKIPFDGGSLRCAEYNGELYIHTCHIMYNGHQANMNICVRESDMTVLDYAADTSVNYVSHSFNQFVLIDRQQRILTWDHGDSYPRSALLMAYKTQAGNGIFNGAVTKVTVQGFPGAAGDNTTGASLGGLAETASGYVLVHNYDGAGTSTSGTTRVVCFSYLDRDTLSGPRQAISDAGTMTPVLAPTGLDGGYVLWNACDEKGKGTDTLYYKPYTADGSLGEVRTATAVLSDCQPICYNGGVVWYATSNSAPVFYVLDDNGVTASKAPAGPGTTPDPTPDPEYGLMVSPSVLDFGTAKPGGLHPASKNLTIANTSGETVRLTASAPENYEISLFHSEMLSAGETTILSVWPKSELPAGNYDATLTISTMDGKASASVSLKYTVTDNASISVGPGTLNFGTVKVGQALPEAQTVTVTNTSKSEVTLRTPSASNYTIGTLSRSTLSAGQTATFTVQPKSGLEAGSYDTSLTVFTSDGKASANISLKYTVTDIASISVNHSTLFFGPRREGQALPEAQTVTVTNTSRTEVTLSLSDPEHYTVSPLSTTTIPARGSATFTVQPKDGLALGTYNGTLTVSTADGEASCEISLMYVVASPITVTPNPVDFGTVRAGEDPPKAVTVRVTNVVSESVTLSLSDPEHYTVSSLTRTALTSGQVASFTVQPKAGLPAGNYDVTLTISSPDGRVKDDLPLKYTVVGGTSQTGFTDVPAGAYYADAVAWAVDKGVTSGTGDHTFSPSQICTEIEILTFLWRAAGKPTASATAPITAIPYYEDFQNALNWAYEKGIIDAGFQSTAPCTRASAVKYIWRAMGSQGAPTSSFTDVPSDADYARAVDWAVANGITAGSEDGTTFSPSTICDRSQIVTFLYRTYVKPYSK